ncbi:MAG: MMPL family transporter [Candidatus Nanohaloarchaea archaeon]
MNRYSELVSRHPGKVLATAILIALVLASGASRVKTVEQSQEDILPDSMPVMKAFDTISEEFPSNTGTSYTVLIQTDPDHPNSNEVRDIRNPEALRYVKTVSNDLRSFDKIVSVSSASQLFQEIPSSKRKVQQTLSTLGEPRWSQYISKDYTSTLIQVEATGLSKKQKQDMAETIRKTVETIDRPPGLEARYTGQPYIDEAFQRQTNQTMSVTSMAAILGVVLTVIILFRSVFHGLASLQTLVFGIAAGFGVFGWLGLNMSPATSGAISMGIGIAIDFGIQPISRYIEERKDLEIQPAISETLEGIAVPMTIGLIAANIGFLTLNFGRVTFLSDLGTLLTLTTTMAYVTAFTVIPSSLILYDRYLTGDSAKGLKFFQNNTRGESNQ